MSRNVLLALVLITTACRTVEAKPDSPKPSPTGEQVCRCADGCVADCAVDQDQTTSYRKVTRDPESVEAAAPSEADLFDVVDVTAGTVLDDRAARQLVEGISIDASDVLVAVRGDFVRGRGTEHAVLTKGGELKILKDGDVFTSVTLGTPSQKGPMFATKLINDRLEVVVRHRESDRERLTVCRVIGRAVGRVFETDLEGATVEFVHRGDERAIRVRRPNTPAELYRWNPWEGMFRIPARAPTAPPR